MWARVHSELEQVRADTAIVQQRVALARRTVADHLVARVVLLDEELEQLTLGLAHPGAECLVDFRAVESA